MPIYEFTCQDCTCRFEELVRNNSDSAKLVCTQCGSADIRRRMSVCGFSSSGMTNSSAKNCNGCASHNCATCH